MSGVNPGRAKSDTVALEGDALGRPERYEIKKQKQAYDRMRDNFRDDGEQVFLIPT